MLRVTIPAQEFYDEDQQIFIDTKETVLELEHSLLSLSKWESKFKKPFLQKGSLKDAETLEYIRCMTLTRNVNPMLYNALPNEVLEAINEYIRDDQTATTFRETKQKENNQVVTSELIYSWMVALNIPFECQKWHLNRLLTLIRVCNIQANPPKKKSRAEVLAEHRRVNRERLARSRTTG